MPKTDEIVEKVVKRLESSIAEDLRSSVRVMIQEVVKEEFASLHKRFDGLGRTMDMWKSDLDDDRENLRGIRTNTGEMTTELKEVGSTVDKLPKKLENAVKDTVRDTVPTTVAEEVPKAVSSTFDVVSKKVKVIEKPKGFFKRLFHL